MAQLYFASFRENKTVGYSLHYKSKRTFTDRGRVDSASFGRRGNVDTAQEVLETFLVHLFDIGVPLENVYVYLPSEGRIGDDHVEKLRGKVARVRRFELSKEPNTKNLLLWQLRRDARAACWGLELNQRNHVPGEPISTEKAQSLHITASKNGWDDGALRLLLSQRGLISMKEVTGAIRTSIWRILSSETLAKKYNQEYQEHVSSTRSAPAVVEA